MRCQKGVNYLDQNKLAIWLTQHTDAGWSHRGAQKGLVGEYNKNYIFISLKVAWIMLKNVYFVFVLNLTTWIKVNYYSQKYR